ncbi:hypothetical protein AMAG_11917 [Allomyces macrogynus ATCC 38327]|uniref:OBG-type G domain-containing protein n=1 Tax=Allomyces macrogynus (strain ATCC 38327) TaxID=578462 RepID=A0A0L0SYR6_ALLM3|nr:hypothetical protein AMAG_11917 [Allomyces macrogynus ATCC 38327]|eukprot:KNE67454.1 hypothetical protein AMAG_11917 [Allomyces macrogynus ATCC 38327]
MASTTPSTSTTPTSSSSSSGGNGRSRFVIGIVGKPSAGKSSFLNAITDASAKTGAFPFTTIAPNHGVAYYRLPCPCARFGLQAQCRPRYGSCQNGTRHVPVEILDVAGLVPGASAGLGLGNQFLDDLRTADALVHVVDVSGTTDAAGKATVGYDPVNDIDWLTSEVHAWVFNNLTKNWGGLVRRHTMLKASPIETLHKQLSGYGCPQSMVAKAFDACPKTLRDKPLETWDQETDVKDFVSVFLKTRFPTVVALNKIDLPDADTNIEKLDRKYGQSQELVLCSALAESFLRKLAKQGFIRYTEDSDDVVTHDDEATLKPMDEKTAARLEKVRDLVLFRYGTTGVHQVLARAVEVLGLVPVFPVKNIHNFTTGAAKAVFRDCLLVPPHTRVRAFASMVHPELDRNYQYAETVGGRMMGEADEITLDNNIISIKTSET